MWPVRGNHGDPSHTPIFLEAPNHHNCIILIGRSWDLEGRATWLHITLSLDHLVMLEGRESLSFWLRIQKLGEPQHLPQGLP